MSDYIYTKFKHISILHHPLLDEKWIAQKITDDPLLLGLGDIKKTGKPEIQEDWHRVSLSFEDKKFGRRYDTLIQCGPANEDDIVSIIEHWDCERQNSLRYDHIGVIAAEEFPDRFLNVLGVLNRFIPITAVKLNALALGRHISLLCTTVLNQRYSYAGNENEDSTDECISKTGVPSGGPATFNMASELLDFIRSFDSNVQTRYHKNFISLETISPRGNCVIFFPQKDGMRFELRAERSRQIEKCLASGGLKIIDYSESGWYRIKLGKGDLVKHRNLLRELISLAYADAVK